MIDTSIWDGDEIIINISICRSKLHDDDESRLIQVVLMITKMMTKSPREWFQDGVKNNSQENDFKIESRTIQESREIWFQESSFKIQDSRFKNREKTQSR